MVRLAWGMLQVFRTMRSNLSRAGGFGVFFQCVWWTLRCGEGSILEDLETNTFLKFFTKPKNPN